MVNLVAEGKGRLPEVRDVRATGICGNACRRRGDRVRVRVRTNANAVRRSRRRSGLRNSVDARSSGSQSSSPPNGELDGAHWFLFKIGRAHRYRMLPPWGPLTHSPTDSPSPRGALMPGRGPLLPTSTPYGADSMADQHRCGRRAVPIEAARPFPRVLVSPASGEQEGQRRQRARDPKRTWPQPVCAPPLTLLIVSFRPGAVERRP